MGFDVLEITPDQALEPDMRVSLWREDDEGTLVDLFLEWTIGEPGRSCDWTTRDFDCYELDCDFQPECRDRESDGDGTAGGCSAAGRGSPWVRWRCCSRSRRLAAGASGAISASGRDPSAMPARRSTRASSNRTASARSSSRISPQPVRHRDHERPRVPDTRARRATPARRRPRARRLPSPLGWPKATPRSPRLSDRAASGR
jgi:hypothetical protein